MLKWAFSSVVWKKTSSEMQKCALRFARDFGFGKKKSQFRQKTTLYEVGDLYPFRFIAYDHHEDKCTNTYISTSDLSTPWNGYLKTRKDWQRIKRQWTKRFKQRTEHFIFWETSNRRLFGKPYIDLGMSYYYWYAYNVSSFETNRTLIDSITRVSVK